MFTKILSIIEERPHFDLKHISIVLAKTDDEYTPYVTWLFNKEVKGYGNGHYFIKLVDAVKDFNER